MTAIDSPRTMLALPALLRSSAVSTWRELPRVVAAGAVALATSAPLLVASIGDAPAWMLVLAGFPPALAATGLARIGAAIARGGRASLGDLVRVDVTLALVLLATATGAVWLVSQDGALPLVGFAVAGVGIAVLPRALGYGAVRDRPGLGALRGGAILAAYRPVATLTILSLAVIGGFAVAATVGALALVVPLLLATFTASVTVDELDAIDSTQAVPR